MMKKKNFSKWLVWFGILSCVWISACSSGSGLTASETRQAEQNFWADIGKTAAEQSAEMLRQATGKTGDMDMIVLTSAGYAMMDGHSTEAVLDGLRDATGTSEGRKSLLRLHRSGDSPLWMFFCDRDTGNGVYYEVEPSSLNLTSLTTNGDLFAVRNLQNIDPETVLAAPREANSAIFATKAFNGNEFSIVSATGLLLKDGPSDLVQSVAFHDHYCPGVVSGYYLVNFFKEKYPLDATHDSYFVLSVPPWCKDDAIQQMLNTTPGKKGYAVAYLTDSETARLREGAENIAGVFCRHNSETGLWEAHVLAFDFTAAMQASGADWTNSANVAWAEKFRMGMWCLDHTDYPLVSEIKNLTLQAGESPSDWDRPGFNVLDRLDLVQDADTEYDFWKGVGIRAAEEAVVLMKAAGASPESGNLIGLTNAGYAQPGERTTGPAIDGLSAFTGISRGKNTLIELHSSSGTSLWFALYDRESGICAYLQTLDSVGTLSGNPRTLTSAELFGQTAAENIQAEHLYANSAEYTEKFNAGIFGGNEFRIVTIANAVDAGAPDFAVRSFEFHDHYCPGVTSGILMASYIRKNFPIQVSGGSYFVQSVSPWCKEDALMVMLNATPGKSGYAVIYPADEDKTKWTTEGQEAVTIVYRKNSDSGLWDGLVLGFTWGDTGCPDYGSSVITKLCSDLWYLERMDQPETFVKVIRQFQLSENAQPKDYARPGVDPMTPTGLLVSETEE